MSTESWVISAPQHVDVAEVTRVVVALNDGSVEIVGDPTRERSATLDVTELSDRPLQVTCHDGELRIAYDFSGVEGVVGRVRGLRDKDRAVLRLAVPAALPVRATTARAAVTVLGIRGDVSVNTATGAVRVHGVTGPLTVKTGSSDVDVVEHVGDLRVSTGSGDVALAGSLGRVSATTVSGSVELVAPESTPLVEVRTVSGDVVVRLGAGTPVNLRARSVTGKVVLDGAALAGSGGRTTSVDHVDEHGRGGAYVSTSTVSGDLAVSRS